VLPFLFAEKGVKRMRTLQAEIKRHNLLQHDNDTKTSGKRKKLSTKRKTRPERLSKRDIEELMGIRRPRYTKQKGVIKQK